MSLKEAFVQVDTGLIANRCYSLAHIDCTLAFPSQPVAFRTTLHNSERGWALYALNEELAKLDDFEVAFPGARLYETITIGSTYRLDIRQLFPEHENQPLVPMPVERLSLMMTLSPMMPWMFRLTLRPEALEAMMRQPMMQVQLQMMPRPSDLSW